MELFIILVVPALGGFDMKHPNTPNHLYFEWMGKWYKVDKNGYLTHVKNDDFSGHWVFLGVSFHHWRQGIDVRFSQTTLPENLIGGLVWDIDHGTIRQWRGRYNGRLPRITQAYWK